MTEQHKTKGFTLIEVMLAVLILGMSLTIFFSATSQGVAVVVQAREYQISKEMLDELSLREPLDLEELEEGVIRGSFTHPDYGRVAWIRTVEIEGKEEDQFYRLTTEVSRGDGQGTLRESVETFIHQPSAIRGGWVQEPFDAF